MNNLYLDRQEKIIHQSYDEYGKLVIKDNGQIRSLYFDDHKKQSAIYTPYPSALLLHYTQAMMSAFLFNKVPKRILLLGLGGGGLIHFLLKAAPQAKIDVVELRHEVIELSKTYFKLPIRHNRLSVHCCDAQLFVSDKRLHHSRQYDMIFVDVFDGEGPSKINGDIDFLVSCRALLTSSGVISFNLWNRRVDLYPLMVKKYRKVFSEKLFNLKLGLVDSNVLLFGFLSSYSLRDLHSFEHEAEKLKQRFGIDFPYFLNQIQRQNFSLASRLKNLILK